MIIKLFESLSTVGANTCLSCDLSRNFKHHNGCIVFLFYPAHFYILLYRFYQPIHLILSSQEVTVVELFPTLGKRLQLNFSENSQNFCYFINHSRLASNSPRLGILKLAIPQQSVVSVLLLVKIVLLTTLILLCKVRVVDYQQFQIVKEPEI